MHGPAQPTKQSKELANAIYDDWKRKVVDDAKKRAVGQAVDYDTFKNMVSVAHLRPLQAPSLGKHDMMLPSWKFGAEGASAAGGGAASGAAAAAAAALMQKEPSEAPSTSGDFHREWRRGCPDPDAKYRYLRLCGPHTLGSLFKVEINVELLKEIIAVVEGCWLAHAGAAEDGAEGSGLQEAEFVVQVLRALSGAGRFQLTVKLMGAATKKVLESLFSQLGAAAQAAAAKEGAETAAGPTVGSAPSQTGGQAEDTGESASAPSDSAHGEAAQGADGKVAQGAMAAGDGEGQEVACGSSDAREGMGGSGGRAASVFASEEDLRALRVTYGVPTV